jgi:hypothetical protein
VPLAPLLTARSKRPTSVGMVPLAKGPSEVSRVGGSGWLEVRLAAPSPLDGPLDAVMLAEIGAPSAIAQSELRAARRPPCAKTARTFKEPTFVVNELTVDEDLSGRRRLRRREPIALHQGL